MIAEDGKDAGLTLTLHTSTMHYMHHFRFNLLSLFAKYINSAGQLSSLEAIGSFDMLIKFGSFRHDFYLPWFNQHSSHRMHALLSKSSEFFFRI